MNKLHVDITNLVKNPERLGLVQCVEREVLNRMIVQDDETEVILLAYDDGKKTFRIVNNNAFLDVFSYNKKNYMALLSEKTLPIQSIPNGSVFFDIENVSNNSLKRGYLYPILKGMNVRIAAFIYDLVPLFSPHYCDTNKVLNSIQYFGAVLQYANRIITCTQTNIERIEWLEAKMQLPPVDKCLVHIGSDFQRNDELSDEIISESIESIAQTEYLLVPGAIEPKKNHTMILDAMEEGLSGVDVVFLGRYGWQSAAIRKRISAQVRENPQFHFFQKLKPADRKFLYEHALATVIASYDDEYCLPILESLQCGTPVIASDIPVFREIGGNIFRYFEPDSSQQFIAVVQNELLKMEAYSKIKDCVASFPAYKWSDTVREIFAAAIFA